VETELHPLPAGFQLRSAKDADGPVVQDLIFGVLREFGLCPDPAATDADLLEIESAYTGRGGWFAVAVEVGGDRIVGTVALQPRTEGVAELRKMYLRPEVRGRGLGRALLQAALGEARRRGFRRLVLETAEALKDAVRLYERNGFRPSSDSPHACRCEIVMELDLVDPQEEAQARGNVADHYARVLGPIYGWMLGDFESAVSRTVALLESWGLGPGQGGAAVDLGSGNGLHTLSLARLGYSVTAVDLCQPLLGELQARAVGLPVRTVWADVLGFPRHLDGPTAVIVCMGDTLTHLPSRAAARSLVGSAAAALAAGGRLVLSFRDYTRPLEGDARFIAVRSDADRIHTCFLEYGPETVRVHDLVHSRSGATWTQTVGSYSKLRLDPEVVLGWLRAEGLSVTDAGAERGMRTIIGLRQ